jgi:hypothetical protein
LNNVLPWLAVFRGPTAQVAVGNAACNSSFDDVMWITRTFREKIL